MHGMALLLLVLGASSLMWAIPGGHADALGTGILLTTSGAALLGLITTVRGNGGNSRPPAASLHRHRSRRSGPVTSHRP
jgi:hypothetical protein